MLSKKSSLKIIALFVIIAVVSFFVFFPTYLDKQTNLLHDSTLPVISDQAKTLHEQLFIGDWHSDTLLWKRELTAKHDYVMWTFQGYNKATLPYRCLPLSPSLLTVLIMNKIVAMPVTISLSWL